MALLEMRKGLEELRTKSLLEIERETALTWGRRAVASFRLAADAPDLPERLRRVMEAENFRQEALEHAAMAEDPELFLAVREEIEAERGQSLDLVREELARPASEPPGGPRRGDGPRKQERPSARAAGRT